MHESLARGTVGWSWGLNHASQYIKHKINTWKANNQNITTSVGWFRQLYRRRTQASEVLTGTILSRLTWQKGKENPGKEKTSMDWDLGVHVFFSLLLFSLSSAYYGIEKNDYRDCLRSCLESQLTFREGLQLLWRMIATVYSLSTRMELKVFG